MKDLKCALKNCKYNKSFCCCADEITVTRTALCASYTPEPDKNGNLFEAGIDETKPTFKIDTEVNCTAPCLFSKHKKCVAVGITVLNERQNAECVTYINE